MLYYIHANRKAWEYQYLCAACKSFCKIVAPLIHVVPYLNVKNYVACHSNSRMLLMLQLYANYTRYSCTLSDCARHVVNSVLQCFAVFCSVWQYVTIWCDTLQCVEVKIAFIIAHTRNNVVLCLELSRCSLLCSPKWGLWFADCRHIFYFSKKKRHVKRKKQLAQIIKTRSPAYI